MTTQNLQQQRAILQFAFFTASGMLFMFGLFLVFSPNTLEGLGLNFGELNMLLGPILIGTAILELGLLKFFLLPNIDKKIRENEHD